MNTDTTPESVLTDGGKLPIDEVTAALHQMLTEHAPCVWKQVGPCVYCIDHNIRLYEGDLPDSKRTTPKCADGEHEWDPEMGLGFYMICVICGLREWCE